MPLIFCNMTGFVQSYPITVYDEKGEMKTYHLSADSLADEIVRLCYQNNIFSVKVKGNREITQNFVEKMAKVNLAEYKDNNFIEVEFVD